MAVHNLFMGIAAKSVGDVTLYRAQGKQVARVRVRDVANPKSEGQATTRNFVAPITRFYGAFHVQLTRSFQGKNKAESYNEFLSRNIRLARQSGWFLEKGAGLFPMPYQLSRGSLPTVGYILYGYGQSTDFRCIWGTYSIGERTVGYISKIMMQNGYKLGDVISFLIMMLDGTGTYIPITAQFIVNPLDARGISQIFNGGCKCTCRDNCLSVYSTEFQVVAGAVILSRQSHGQWYRSTQYMAVATDIISYITSAETKAETIKSYGPNESSGEGESYLDGDGVAYNVATISGRALLFYGGQYAAVIENRDGILLVKLKPANLNEYFYVKKDATTWLRALSANDLVPANWQFRYTSNSPGVDNNSILYTEDSDFAKYLLSLGFTGTTT